MESFQERLAQSYATRSTYSNLFQNPSSFHFCVGSSEEHKLLFLYKGVLCTTTLVNFGLARSWEKIVLNSSRSLTRNEQLLRERMRVVGHGIIKYDYFADSKLILCHGPIPVLSDLSGNAVATFPSCEGALNLQLCPTGSHLLACVCDGDIFLLNSKTDHKHQLTFTNGQQISAGLPPYIIQEEFDRYDGFWWQKSGCGDVLRILYEEVHNEEVEQVHTFNPVSQSVEQHFYPRPGKNNARSLPKMLVLIYKEDGQLDVEERMLCCDLSSLFPNCCEYIVRLGWMPGKRQEVWLQLLDRQQRHLLIVVIHVSSFVPVNAPKDPSVIPNCYILYEESSSVWITVSDCFEFLPCKEESQSIRFLWLSEQSGYKHLYLIEATPPAPASVCGEVARAGFVSQRITRGEWSVLGPKVWLDAKSEVVYFQANKMSPLEKHFYAVSLTGQEELRQLTKTGFYHDVTLDTDNFAYFVSVYSSTVSNIKVSVHSLLQPHDTISEWHGRGLPSSYSPPSSFTVCCETGEELYGCVYPPVALQAGLKYPTIVYVYGGPGIQMVTSGLSKHLPRIQTWCQHGFAVVMLDNRGSANRGLHFEAYLKGRLGLVEIRDQVLGVEKAAKCVDYIDSKKVGIMGWSYGGYLSLMAIAQYPEIFNVCVAGAPVTDWYYYDTGYTERYLGIPPSNPSKATVSETPLQVNLDYEISSVLQYASKFPSSADRVLIVHGLSDENVLFTHSASLCDKMVSLGKPYTLQMYSGERHGLRSMPNATHCDATIVQFLKNNFNDRK